MKKGLFFYFIILIVSCDFYEVKHKKEKEIEVENQVAKTKDSLIFEEALNLYKSKAWNKSVEKFKKINPYSIYINKAKEYIVEIENRPWKREFGDGITTTLKGEFSNSATKDSPLWVEMTIYKNNQVWLNLYEYSASKPSNITAEKPTYNFSLYVKSDYLCRNVNQKKYYGIDAASHSEGIVFSGKLAERVIKKIKESEKRCYFSIEMGSSSSYTFSVDAKFFEYEFNSL